MERVKYSKEEITPIGEYLTFGPTGPTGSLPRYKTPVDQKDNLYAVLKGEIPLWMPMTSDINVYLPKCIQDNRVRAMVSDVVPLKREEMGGIDMFGVEWIFVDTVGGSMVKPGKPMLDDVNDWKEVIKFPDIEAWDWEGCAQRNQPLFHSERPNATIFTTGFFERLISFMDFENAVTALIDEEQQDAVHELFRELCGLYEKIFDKYKKYFNIDIITFHDDWGSQRAPFFSLDTCREMIVPYIKHMSDYAHSLGIYFELHCCGKNDMLVPAMIEAGVDMWTGQIMNDKKALYEQYGKDIILGIEIPVAPDASDEEIYVAARAFMEKYGSHMEDAPVIFNDESNNVKLREYVYEISRQMYNN